MAARDLPRVSDLIEPNIRAPLSRVIEEVQRLTGFRGEARDRAITEGRAIDLGLIDELLRPIGGGGSGTPGPAGPPGPPGPPGPGVTPPDLTPPPTATGLAVDGGFSSVIVRWDAATYTTGHGPGQTNIYAVKRDLAALGVLPVFGDAARVATVYGAGNITALPSELNTRWYVWIKFQSVDGVESVAPAGGTNGVQADTGQDVTQLLEVLTGSITASQLATALGNRIDLIDASSAVTGSVDYRLAQASTTLTSAFAAGDAATYANAQTYVGTYAYSKSAVDGAFTSQFGSLTANYTAADATTYSNAQAYVATYAYSKATVDGALAGQFSTLTANYSAADTVAAAGAVATANAFTTSYTYSTAGVNGAIAGAITSYSATVNGQISAAVAVEAGARAFLDNSVAALYTVRAEISAAGRTMVGGFGLSATSTTSAGPRIDFGIRADRFWVSAPSTATGVADIVPFTILTTPSVEDGVTIPAGIYMDAAYMRNLSAMVAKIGVAVIDDAKIASLSAAKLTAGALAVGQYVRSTGYVAGTAGYNFDGSGNFEINNLVARGTIYASAGTIGGITLGAGYLRSPGYVPGTTGFQLKSDDTADFGSGATFGGKLQVGSSPSVSGTTMTGAGAVFMPSGIGGFGNATSNINFNGHQITINGPVVATANLFNGSVTENKLGLAPFSASIPSGDLTVSVGFGHQTYGARSVAVSGGIAPYSYFWVVSDGGYVYRSVGITGGQGSDTVTIAGSAEGETTSSVVACFITDSNARTTMAKFAVLGSHANDPGGGGFE